MTAVYIRHEHVHVSKDCGERRFNSKSQRVTVKGSYWHEMEQQQKKLTRMFPSLVDKLKNKWLWPFHLFITEIYTSIKGGSIHMEAATLRRRRSTADQGRGNTQHLLILLGRQRWREELAAFALYSFSPLDGTKSHTLGLFNCLYAIQIQPHDVVVLSCMFQRNKTSPRESRAAAGVAALSLHWGNKHAANIINWRQVKVKWQGELMMLQPENVPHGIPSELVCFPVNCNWGRCFSRLC